MNQCPAPVRPLPSTNGWIVSNWACAIAAWTSGDSASSLQNTQRSSMSGGRLPAAAGRTRAAGL